MKNPIRNLGTNEGNVVIITKCDGKWIQGSFRDYKFSATVYRIPSPLGLYDSTVSQLTISQNNNRLYQFDRGSWKQFTELSSSDLYAFNKIYEYIVNQETVKATRKEFRFRFLINSIDSFFSSF